jgi:5-(carboxyamino)imidazole ribonucleotide synthase
VISRSTVGTIATYPLARNRHDRGILVESVAPAAVPEDVTQRAVRLGERLAVMMGITGTLTAELFLMPDGRLLVNELAPRVHNSGHWTIDGATTSQFEQHIRAICGLDLGATDVLAATAVVNLLGSGATRAARLEPTGLARSMADPMVHLHVYDKRRVFERRKMGHVAATGSTTDEALEHARAAAALIEWEGAADRDDRDGNS